MIKLTDYYKIYESEQNQLNEGLFSSIKGRRFLNKMSGLAEDLYNAIVNKYDIDIDYKSFQLTKEWNTQLSNIAKARKTEAYNKKREAAGELISEIQDRCTSYIASADVREKWIAKAKDMVKDAEARARRERIARADREISRRDVEDLRSDWDDELEAQFGRNFSKISKPTKEKTDKEKELADFKKKLKGCVKVPRKYYASSANDVTDWEDLPPDVKESDVSPKLAEGPDGELYGIPTDEFKNGLGKQKYQTYILLK